MLRSDCTHVQSDQSLCCLDMDPEECTGTLAKMKDLARLHRFTDWFESMLFVDTLSHLLLDVAYFCSFSIKYVVAHN